MKTKVVIWVCFLLIAVITEAAGQRTSLILLPASTPRPHAESQVGRYVPKSSHHELRNIEDYKRPLFPVMNSWRKVIFPGRMISVHVQDKMNSKMSGSVRRVTGLPVISGVQDNYKKTRR